MSDFYPISPLIGITNTSYAAQAGVMDDKWAVRVVRGKKVIAEKTINSLDLESVVGVIYGHARIEGLSRHSVAMTAGRLMQYARRYQQSGVCPNFEVPDLVHLDGTTHSAPHDETPQTVTAPGAGSTPNSAAVDESRTAQQEISLEKLGTVPELSTPGLKDLWRSCVEARAHAILAMALYGASLPEGHTAALFDMAVENIVWDWSRSGDAAEMIRRFASFIQSCSGESQIPVTKGARTIETGTCELLRMARELDPEAQRIPAGYPCKFHEALARRVSEITGVKILVNASSTGCKVTFMVE